MRRILSDFASNRSVSYVAYYDKVVRGYWVVGKLRLIRGTSAEGARIGAPQAPRGLAVGRGVPLSHIPKTFLEFVVSKWRFICTLKYCYIRFVVFLSDLTPA